MDKRLRIISSISDVITNSSTQVFMLDIDDRLKELVENGELDRTEIMIIESKEEFLKYLQDYEDNRKTNKYYDNGIFDFLEELTNGTELYNFLTYYDSPSKIWDTLNKKGKSYSEIGEFFWPLIEDEFGKRGKIYYSYEDDCGDTPTGDLLFREGYESWRD